MVPRTKKVKEAEASVALDNDESMHTNIETINPASAVTDKMEAVI